MKANAQGIFWVLKIKVFSNNNLSDNHIVKDKYVIYYTLVISLKIIYLWLSTSVRNKIHYYIYKRKKHVNQDSYIAHLYRKDLSLRKYIAWFWHPLRKLCVGEKNLFEILVSEFS